MIRPTVPLVQFKIVNEFSRRIEINGCYPETKVNKSHCIIGSFIQNVVKVVVVRLAVTALRHTIRHTADIPKRWNLNSTPLASLS